MKSRNILLTADNVIKLADLGVAKVMQEYIVAEIRAGTENYMSPEIIDRKEYSFPTDIWYYIYNVVYSIILSIELKIIAYKNRSLGCVLYELVFFELAVKRGKENPFDGSPNFSPLIKRSESDYINLEILILYLGLIKL